MSRPTGGIEPVYILALDPGVTVGWASFHKPNERDGYHSGQFNVDSTWTILDNSHSQYSITQLVVERFVYRRRPKVDLTPAENIGVIKEWAKQNKVSIVWQTPSQAMAYWTDNRLKEMGLYRAGKPHANDAMRHLLYYVNFTTRIG